MAESDDDFSSLPPTLTSPTPTAPSAASQFLNALEFNMPSDPIFRMHNVNAPTTTSTPVPRSENTPPISSNAGTLTQTAAQIN